MSRPFLTRIAIVCVAAAAALVLAACGDTARDVSIARTGVAHFHQQLDAEKYDDIYNEAAPEFRNAAKREDFLAIAAAVHRKLGKVKDATQTRFFVNWTTSGTSVTLSYHTKFDGGDAAEEFAWKIEGSKAMLVGYNINSTALIVK